MSGPARRSRSSGDECVPGSPRGPIPRVSRDNRSLAEAFEDIDNEEEAKIDSTLQEKWNNMDFKTHSNDDEWTILIKYINQRAYYEQTPIQWKDLLTITAQEIKKNIRTRCSEQTKQNITNFLISVLKEASYKGKKIEELIEYEFRGKPEEDINKNVTFYKELYLQTVLGLAREVEELQNPFGDLSSISEHSEDESDWGDGSDWDDSYCETHEIRELRF